MFVLCPHCHFLVGIDPRTGRPPANCPKCSGLVVEPLPDMPAGSVHADDIPMATALPLAPFAPVELPSVLPTLPEVVAEAEPETGHASERAVEPVPGQQEQPGGVEPIIADAVAEAAPDPVPAALETATTPVPKPRWWSRGKAEPAKAATPQPEVAVAPAGAPAKSAVDAPSAAPASPDTIAPAEFEVAVPPTPKLRWWSRRKAEPAKPGTPQPAAAIPPPPASATSEGPIAIASRAETEAPRSADTIIAALQVRRRATRKPVEAAPAPVPSPPVVATVEVEVDALPPAVRIEDVVADAAAISQVETPAEAPAGTSVELPATISAERILQTSAAATAVEHPAPTRASVEDAAVAPAPATADVPAAPHPLRRRTDFDPTATAEPIAGGVPPHPLRRRTDAPSFTRPRVRTSAVSRIGWRIVVAVGGLSLLLLLQLLLAQRDILAASPRWRPTIASVCATLGCSLPPWHEPAAFTMLSRDVRPHPGAPGTLLINASFRNDARWSQPWPRLLLTLSDLDGRMVGARSFAADEYLGATPTQSELAPGQTAAVTLSVVEPAPNIVAFTFDFR